MRVLVGLLAGVGAAESALPCQTSTQRFRVEEAPNGSSAPTRRSASLDRARSRIDSGEYEQARRLAQDARHSSLDRLRFFP
jgi:hypothetical protein